VRGPGKINVKHVRKTAIPTTSKVKHLYFAIKVFNYYELHMKMRVKKLQRCQHHKNTAVLNEIPPGEMSGQKLPHRAQ